MTAADAADRIAVGRIGPARGVRGAVFVEPWTDTPAERFAEGAALLTDPADAGPLHVASSTLASGKLVVQFDGVDDRAAAEQLRGTELFVTGLAIASLAGLELAFREHFAGYRSHSALLAGAVAVAVVAGLYYFTDLAPGASLGVGAAIGALCFWAFARAFRNRAGRLVKLR